MVDWHATTGMWVDRLSDPICDFEFNLTLDFKGQMLKKLYIRNGKFNWYGTKGMWVDRMLDPLCDLELWPWPWIFKGQIWKKLYPRNGMDMEWKGCDLIGSWTHFETLNFDPAHDLDIGFSRSNFEKKMYPRNGMVTWHGMKGMWVDRKLDPLFVFELWPHPWLWPWIF